MATGVVVDPKSPDAGSFITDDGTVHGFLPAEPPTGPIAEFISTEADEKSPDGLKHYKVDENEIAAFYAAQGKRYPAPEPGGHQGEQ